MVSDYKTNLAEKTVRILHLSNLNLVGESADCGESGDSGGFGGYLVKEISWGANVRLLMSLGELISVWSCSLQTVRWVWWV